MLLLNENDIKSVVTMKEVIEADKKAFRMIAAGDVEVPLRTAINAPAYDGVFLFMPSYAPGEEAAAIKVINVFPRNPEKGLDTCPAQVMFIDGRTGYVAAIMDGAAVTRLRTGASSGAAFDILGKKDCRIGGLIGTGGQAASQLEAMVCVRQLEEVRVFDIYREKCASFCARMQEELKGYGTRIVPVESADEAACDADLFIT
ncbi:MAG: ornithine cyclodeaminase family protein, partial [Lachnospiraceae bacterium]|nr:ornithine cyclodeaminase family protein [Lachnospiraceae bacterium]